MREYSEEHSKLEPKYNLINCVHSHIKTSEDDPFKYLDKYKENDPCDPLGYSCEMSSKKVKEQENKESSREESMSRRISEFFRAAEHLNLLVYHVRARIMVRNLKCIHNKHAHHIEKQVIVGDCTRGDVE